MGTQGHLVPAIGDFYEHPRSHALYVVVRLHTSTWSDDGRVLGAYITPVEPKWAERPGRYVSLAGLAAKYTRVTE